MREMVNELIEYRELLYILAWRDIKIRYKQAAMGFCWAILLPLCMVGAGIIVRAAISFTSGKHLDMADVASVAVKSLPWSFFIASLRFATISLVANNNLITKIYFPREIFPISAVLANLFDFCIASSVLIVFLIFAKIHITVYILWLPLLLILLILFATASGMFFACANLFFRDVKYIVEVILTLAIFFTPVFYDAATFGKWAKVLFLNPVAVLLESINSVVVLGRPPDPLWIAYAACWSVFGALFSWFFFHRLEFLFAERI
jgi:lipopolysaccharide transport system permease protein